MLADGQRLLLVEDEPLQREMLKEHLEAHGFAVFAAESSEEALEELGAHRIDVVLTDYRLPGDSGIELLEAVHKVAPGVDVVLMTAYATADMAVRAMKVGARDFVTKPLDLDALDAVLGRIVEGQRLVAENQRLRRRLAELSPDIELIGQSFAFRQVLDLTSRVASTDSTVLITGETGCGKELLADLIHRKSRRREGPLVKLNCGAIPHELFESELFGHRRGAFTGATVHRSGRIAEAHRGTLMLDEVGELPMSAQVKLLRVLENGSFFPVGSDVEVRSDARLVACSNRDLSERVKKGAFREDLFFRLNVLPIHIPPLRERREDISPLLDHYLGHFTARLNAGPRKLSSSARDALVKYDWPGNVRQIRNVVERLVILSRDPVIGIGDLPADITVAPAVRETPTLEGPLDLEALLGRIEEQHIRRALEVAKGNQTRAGEMLGLSERALRYKLKKYGISRGAHQ